MIQTTKLSKAQAGDIRAFHELFAEFEAQLKSYLYRLTARRNETEDLAQDVFILAFEGVKKFRQDADLKTWVFTIATNRARRHLKKQARWRTDTFVKTRERAHSEAGLLDKIHHINDHSPQGAYEIREHIDYCFSCVGKMLSLEQNIAILLKDVYAFKIDEIAEILQRTPASVKHLVRDARQTMIAIFDETCALVSKRGVCNQCSELNGRFNPKQDRQKELMKIKMVKDRKKHNVESLLELRAQLVRNIDPLQANGVDLHDSLMEINHRVNGTEHS